MGNLDSETKFAPRVNLGMKTLETVSLLLGVSIATKVSIDHFRNNPIDLFSAHAADGTPEKMGILESILAGSFSLTGGLLAAAVISVFLLGGKTFLRMRKGGIFSI